MRKRRQNPSCWLCIPAAAQITPNGLDSLSVPKAPLVLVTIHNYAPNRFSFALNAPEAERTLEGVFTLIQSFQSRTGVTIMITEYGAMTKIDREADRCNDSDRAAYKTAFLSCAKALAFFGTTIILTMLRNDSDCLITRLYVATPQKC